MIGSLLIAHPLLNDGYFNRSVVHISQYSEEGIVGFILNFKTQFKLRDVRPQVKNGNFPIYDGGPVARNQLFFLHTLGEKVSNSLHVKDNLFFGGDFYELLHIIDHEDISENEVRFFAGYSGWDVEQLDDEIAKKSWYVNANPQGNILVSNPDYIWGNELAKQKSGLRIFSEIGYDPSLN